MSSPRFPEVVVELVDRDGNALTIVGAVARALRDADEVDGAAQWTAAAWSCGSYDELLRLAMATVDVA